MIASAVLEAASIVTRDSHTSSAARTLPGWFLAGAGVR